jgi:tetratricopeptide (TPR) repeat protein
MEYLYICIDFSFGESYYSTDFYERLKMRKTAITTLTLLVFLCSLLPAQNANNETYIKAMTTPDPNQKAQLLKEYVTNNRGAQYENFACAELTLLTYNGKTAADTIKYGERALELGGLDPFQKCRVLITVANMYVSQSQNLPKVSNYATQIIQTAKANKNNELASAATWNQFVGGGSYLKGQALEKTKNYKGAVDAYINAYNILKSPQIISNSKKLGKVLYDGKAYKDAEKALKIAATNGKDFASIYLYANALNKNGKLEDALSNYKMAYMKQKSGAIAFNIGIILAKKAGKNASFTDEALKYLLDASFLSKANSKKAMQMAESLYFLSKKDLKYNENVQELQQRSKKLEDLTKDFNDKYGEKEEEDLSDGEKSKMESMLKQIDAEQEAVKRLAAETQAALQGFQQLLEKAKQRLGIQ